MSSEHVLTIPLRVEDIEGVKAGDTVLLTGCLFTARPRWYKRILEEGYDLPINIEALGANVLLHSGPVMKQLPSGEWKMATMVTMPDWMADGTTGNIKRILERIHLRAFIGKGELAGTDQLCKQYKCLRLITIGTWNDFACNVRRVVDVAWLELGATEAMWVFEVDRMGPFVVEADIHGNSLYAQRRAKREERIKQVMEARGLREFTYSTPDYPRFLRNLSGKV
jgi:L(+)-tartrate dehydratase beta subunit